METHRSIHQMRRDSQGAGKHKGERETPHKYQHERFDVSRRREPIAGRVASVKRII
jgi:hypothetical protein